MVVETPPAVRPGGRLTRGAYRCLGLTFVGMGMVGVVVPVWPTTIFFILALWAFKRSSARLEHWLLSHPIFGPTLRDWDQNRTIKRRTKVIAISTLWAGIGLSLLLIHRPVVWAILVVVGVAVTVYIVRQRTAPES